ncbi:MAG: ribonuclease H-like domain-containing protein [Candidatus Methylacidiphilales bacterium]|nr:ribonuclease H-like domain-containing protein [Candidatus Methylacidiphilales bacterium]
MLRTVQNFVYFDLETQKSAAEVGGWHNKAAMRMSLGVTYSTQRGTYMIYDEANVDGLIAELQRADCVIGYNIRDFDYEVLAPYCIFDLSQVATLDLIDQVETHLSRRIGLDAIATETLGVGKTAVGLDALKWWKEGRLRDIAEYCCFDVKATRLVHEYGARYGRVFFFNEKTGRRETIPTPWPQSGAQTPEVMALAPARDLDALAAA